MSGFLDKMSSFFFKDEDNIEEDISESGDYQSDAASSSNERNVWREPDLKKAAKKTHLLTVPVRDNARDASSMEMILIKATSYEDMQEIARHIKEKKIAVVNFEEMDKEVAQRMVDFLSGATFALDGVPRKVSGGTFIFSSANVDVSGQIMEKDNSVNDNINVAAANDSRYNSNQWFNK